MNIAIIGAGNVGKALGTSFARAGHQVTYAASNPEHAKSAADAVGGSTAGGTAEAAKAADIVVLAVPFASAARGVASELGPVAAGKVVIDVTNPLNADASGLDTQGGHSGAEQLAAWMPGARVVKAFNTLFASVQADPGAHGVTVDAMFATDDQDARRTVAELIASLGFRPVYVGPLARAHELEAIAFLNIRLQIEAQGGWQTAFTLVGAPESATKA